MKRALLVAFVAAINKLSIEEQRVALDPQAIRVSNTNAFTTTRQ